MTSVFVSYRRAAADGYAGRLYDRLKLQLGADQVFMDVTNVSPGTNFWESLSNHVKQCEVFIALIHPGWASVTNQDGSRRLDNESDYVRREIEIALNQRKVVLPVLVNGAEMPAATELPEPIKTFSHFQCIHLRHDSYDSDSNKLLELIQQWLEARTKNPLIQRQPRQQNVGKRSNKELTLAVSGSVRIEHVSVFYTLAGESFAALNDITVSIESGARVAIAGPPGSGKSTLLFVTSLIETPPVGGIWIGGLDALTCSPSDLVQLRSFVVRYVGPVLDIPLSLRSRISELSPIRRSAAKVIDCISSYFLGRTHFPGPMTVFEHTYTFLLNQKQISGTQCAEHVKHWLGAFNLTKYSNERLSNLTYGLHQRLEFVRATITPPKILVVDDTAISICEDNGFKVLDVLNTISRAYGMTLIFSTSTKQQVTYAERLVRLDQGSISVLGVKVGTNWALARRRAR